MDLYKLLRIILCYIHQSIRYHHWDPIHIFAKPFYNDFHFIEFFTTILITKLKFRCNPPCQGNLIITIFHSIFIIFLLFSGLCCIFHQILFQNIRKQLSSKAKSVHLYFLFPQILNFSLSKITAFYRKHLIFLI